MSESSPYAVTMSVTSNAMTGPKASFNIVDETTDNIIWSKKLNYWTEKVDIYGPYVITTHGNSITVYELGSGRELYKLKLSLGYVDLDRDLIIGHKGKKIECYRLSDQTQLWHSEFDEKDNGTWQVVDAVEGENDRIIFCSKHLYALNLTTGELDTHKLNVSAADKKSNALLITGAVMGSLIGCFTGVAIIPYQEPSTMNDLHSNILNDSCHYYIADKKHITCLDTDMNQVWSYALPDKMGARSRLYCSGDTLFMLNEGYGMSNDVHRCNIGKPFFAAFDMLTGENRFIRHLPEHWDESVYGNNIIFASDGLFHLNQSGDKFMPITNAGLEYPVLTTNGDVHMIDNGMNVGNIYYKDDVYHRIGEIDGLTVIEQNTENPDFYLIRHDGTIIRRLPDDYTFVMVRGRKICAFVSDHIIFTDIDELQSRP